jgi:hypothetical protein
MRQIRSVIAIAILASACASSRTEPETFVELDRRGNELLVGRPSKARPEADAPPSYDVFLTHVGSSDRKPIATHARAAGFESNAIWFIDAERVLWRRSEDERRRLIDRVIGRPALLPNGTRVVSRAGGEPGESDLVVVEDDGGFRTLATAPGPDDLPTALPDGRVAFVSGRTGLASLYVVDPKDEALVQLTNRGARRIGPDFVPPPARRIEVSAAWLDYDDGHGDRWHIEIATGRAERSRP